MNETGGQSLYLSHWPRLAGRGLVIAYRYTLAPLIGPRCRHLPGCSEYAEQAIMRFGLWAGSWMALARHQRNSTAPERVTTAGQQVGSPLRRKFHPLRLGSAGDCADAK